MTASDAKGTRHGLGLLQAAALVLIVLKLLHALFAGPFMDETYYWMWGQHPAWSYFDHPPLNAWLLAASDWLFGWNPIALRAPVILTFAADVGAIWLLSKRIAPADVQHHFWTTLVLFLAMPVTWMVSSLAIPDHVLLCASLYALYFFVCFFDDRNEGGDGRTRDLLLGAITLGLAALSKYNAAFIGLAIPLYAVVKDRRLFRDPRLYLAGALTLLMQAPVIYWNLTEGFASWQFILQGRHAGLQNAGSGLAQLALLTVLFVSPFALWGAVRIAAGRVGAAPGMDFARTILIVSTVAITVVASRTQVLFHWNLMTYVAMLPFLVQAMRQRWLLWGQVAYGMVFAGLAVFNYTVQPVLDVRAYRDEATAWSYGWDTPASRVRQLADHNGTAFIATSDYTTASLLGFALGNRDVVSLGLQREAFDFWFDAAAHHGKNAILLGDDYHPIDTSISGQFTSVELLDTVAVSRGNQVIDTYRIYLGRAFSPPGP